MFINYGPIFIQQYLGNGDDLLEFPFFFTDFSYRNGQLLDRVSLFLISLDVRSF